MDYHPVANLFPLMEGEDFDSFMQDIKEHGLKEPIVTFKGKIIDGRNRFRACRELNIKPIYVEWDGEGSMTEFVVSLNLHRRHLTHTQKGCWARRCENPCAEAKERQWAGVKPDLGEISSQGRSADIAAAAVHTSPFNVKKAAQVVKHGTPSLVASMNAAKAPAIENAAAVATMLPPEEQEELVAAGPEAVNERGKALLQEKKSAPALYDPSTPEPLGSKGIVHIGKYLDGRIEHWARETSEHAEAVFAELNKVRMDVCGR